MTLSLPLPVASRGMRWLMLAAATCLLVACASSDKPKPAALEAFKPALDARVAWTAKLDSVRYPMAAVARAGRFYVAGTDGQVVALNGSNGAEVWRASAGGSISAGVGSDGRFASVVTTDNEVVTFDAGRVVWRARVPSRVVTAPFVAGERVFVMSVDRVVHAFDALDGRKLWVFQRPSDALTLAQAGVLTSYRDLLVVGQGSRLTALDSMRGTVQWEVPMAAPRGTNEVERLADLIGPAVRVGDRICARAFQSAAACADAARAAPVWSRGTGGAQAVAANAEVVVGADASDRLTGWRANNGDTLWTHEKLLNRGLSGGAMFGNHAVFGDAEGQLHFLLAMSGETQQRLATDGSPIVGTPLLAGNTLLVATRNGGLFAIRSN